jgi:hypothetical protein
VVLARWFVGTGGALARHGGDVEVNRGNAEQREAEGRRRGRAGNLVGDGKKPMAPGVVPRETALSGGLSTESEEGAETHRLGRD